MKRIKLSKGAYAIIDDIDFEEINKFKWHFASVGYAATKYSNKILYLHRLILKAKKGQEVDHINRNKLDNRRSNLRFVSRSLNIINAGLRITNKSGFKGVWWNKDKKKWTAEIWRNYKKKHLGHFLDKEEAALAYNKAAKVYFGDFARLNDL
jgi:hypothetical protein